MRFGSRLQPELPGNYLVKHPFNHGHMNVRDEVVVSGVWEHRDEQTIRNELGREFACSENIDIQIGRVLKKLESMGELENTYIIYAAGFRVTGNIYLLDTLVTICDLAGIETPASNEGISFKPVLQGKQKTVRDVLCGIYSGGQKPGIGCVKKGDWKLMKYDVAADNVHETQLFNLAENPHEFLPQHHDARKAKLTGTMPTENQTNLANDAKYADKLAEMEALDAATG